MSHFIGLGIWKAGLAQKSIGEIMWGLAGIGLAGSSVAFASYMIANSDAGPRINGADQLAIFAKPANNPYNGGGQRADRPAFDTMPVGTVRARTTAVSVSPVEKVAAGYYMRGYSQGAALVQGPDGFVTVKVGDLIEGVGRVTAIEGRGRSLFVITTGGVIAGDD
jgi:hypothetical protein